jgi:hypothetical protein
MARRRSSRLDPYGKEFPLHLAEYCREMGRAKSRDWHHDQRRALFMDLLSKGFGVEAREVELEHKLKAAQVKKGFIDALYRTTIFEFKSDLKREWEAGRSELRRYIQSRARPSDYLAVLTDGLDFFVFQWLEDSEEKLDEIDFFAMRADDPRETFVKIEQFLRSAKPRKPTSAEIVLTLGPNSVIYNRACSILEEIHDRVKATTHVATKYREWNRLLAKAYGEELGSERLFLTHTYLVVLSRLMVAQALYPQEKRTSRSFRGVMTGEYFTKKNLPNLAEPDFFSWALDTPVEKDFIGVIARIDAHLGGFDFSSTEEDILKELYQGLVDPVERHTLGEYYTPEWLAELTLLKLGYEDGTLLDPACGSGTFLMCAVRRLRASGLRHRKLVEAVTRDLAGIDVHQLAVLMAKANLILALGGEARSARDPIRLPIFMADTLQTDLDEKKGCLTVPAGKEGSFHLPLRSVDRPAEDLDEMIEEMTEYAGAAARGDTDLNAAKHGFLQRFPFLESDGSGEGFFWRQNVELASKLIRAKKNSVWAFVLKNSYRPTFLRRRKAQYVVGNPPWLSYRYIKDARYQARVRTLARELGLIEGRGAHLMTQLDLSTIFYRFCERDFLADGGRMAMVLPKSVVIGAKQHAPFQNQGGFSLLIDCENVENLFNVPCCVLFQQSAAGSGREIPAEAYSGKVSPRNMPWSKASESLVVSEGVHALIEHEVRSPWYRDRAQNGVSFYPRAFWFVENDLEAAFNSKAPYLRSAEALVADAKDIWKTEKVALSGQIEAKYLFNTALAKGLLPFAVRRREVIFVPVSVDAFSGRLIVLSTDQLAARGDRMAMSWLAWATRLWDLHRRSTNRTVLDWLDYSGKLSGYAIESGSIVIFNASGTNLTAARIDASQKEIVGGIRTNGFIPDGKTYYIRVDSEIHGAYLCSILNASVVIEAVKRTMPRGLLGERDIHRRPFEACRIPLFDPKNSLHQDIGAMGLDCERKAEAVVSEISSPVGRARQEMRGILKKELSEVDRLAARLLGETPRAPKRRIVTPGELTLF